jgi:hypothetical protein
LRFNLAAFLGEGFVQVAFGFLKFGIGICLVLIARGGARRRLVGCFTSVGGHVERFLNIGRKSGGVPDRLAQVALQTIARRFCLGLLGLRTIAQRLYVNVIGFFEIFCFGGHVRRQRLRRSGYR